MIFRKSWLSLAWAGLLWSAAVAAAAEKDIAASIKELSSPDLAVRQKAAVALGAAGDKSETVITALMGALSDKEPAVQRAAVQALRDLKLDPEVMIPRLAKLLGEAPPPVAISIVGILAERGEKAVPNIILALDHPEARYWAALVVQDIGPAAKGTVDALLKALSAKEQEVRRELVLALGAIGPEAGKAVPTLIKLVGDEDPAVVIAATYSLGQIGPNAAAAGEVLTKNLKAEDDFLRVVSAWSLAATHPKDKAIEKQVVPILVAGLTHPELRGVRRAAAHALVQLSPDHEVLLPTVLKAMETSKPEVVMDSVEALAAVGRDAVPGLAKLLKFPQVLPLVAQVLGNLGSKAAEAVPAMTAALEKADATGRRELLMALGKMGEAAAPAVPAIAKQLEDEDGQVKMAAVYALQQLGLAARDAKGPLRKGLTSEDALFKFMSAEALVAIDPLGQDTIKDCVPVLAAALKHEQPLVRAGAAHSLATLKKQAKAALPGLKAAANDPDARVKAAVQAAIKAIE